MHPIKKTAIAIESLFLNPALLLASLTTFA
jgi:hypothetical protein